MRIERDFTVTEIGTGPRYNNEGEFEGIDFSISIGNPPSDADGHPDTFDMVVSAEEARRFYVGQSIKVTFETYD